MRTLMDWQRVEHISPTLPLLHKDAMYRMEAHAHRKLYTRFSLLSEEGHQPAHKDLAAMYMLGTYW